MTSLDRRLIASIFALCVSSGTFAQDRPPVPNAPNAAAPALTGKERTGRKWMDEQRIDNCNVPADKRGSKPRPNDCQHAPPS
jgi:hypothetical protein